MMRNFLQPDDYLFDGVFVVIKDVARFENDSESTGCDEFNFLKVGLVARGKQVLAGIKGTTTILIWM